MCKKKIVRLAVIREMDEKGCPFGLNIPNGCQNAGDLVDNMTPIESKGGEDVGQMSPENLKLVIESNNRVLMLAQEQRKICKYANYIFKNQPGENKEEKVECNFGDTAEGVGVANFNATTPLNQYLGVGYYSVPLGFYNQDLTYTDGFQAYVNRYFASADEDGIKKDGNKK